MHIFQRAFCPNHHLFTIKKLLKKMWFPHRFFLQELSRKIKKNKCSYWKSQAADFLLLLILGHKKKRFSVFNTQLILTTTTKNGIMKQFCRLCSLEEVLLVIQWWQQGRLLWLSLATQKIFVHHRLNSIFS